MNFNIRLADRLTSRMFLFDGVSWIMSVWLRRLSITLFLLFWLALLLTPSLAFILARNGQIQIGRIDDRHWRLFLLQEADVEGLGLERGRAVSPPLEAPGARCLKTTVDYWLWAGEEQGADYCQCYGPANGEVLSVTPPACQSP